MSYPGEARVGKLSRLADDPLSVVQLKLRRSENVSLALQSRVMLTSEVPGLGCPAKMFTLLPRRANMDIRGGCVRPKLGELLVRAGVLTQEQVQDALSYQRRYAPDSKLGEIVLTLKMTSEEKILAVLSKALGFKAIDLRRFSPKPEALATVSSEMARKHQMLPLRVESVGRRKRLWVAMADPANLPVIDEIQFRTGMVVEPVLATVSQVYEAINRAYLGHPSTIPLEMTLESSSGPNEKLTVIRDGQEQTWIGHDPRDEKTHGGAPIAQLSGCGGAATGQVFVLRRHNTLVFGRSNESNAVVQDLHMSRQHFRVMDTGSGIELEDLGSSNGTFVNQRRVQRVQLYEGDWIQAGDSIFRVIFPPQG